MSLDNKSYYP